ncbi:MAG TPA: prepilin-type N-terminal cleavage/methylation domain-containing protein [Longimicrobiales bacterium]|nr:prepilin-type N-terminal cleavage/methylation domain-containing protein [Longimicrobiales bacterium]
MIKPRCRVRPGFSLTELLIALLLTAIVGASVTGVFVTQTRFFAQQEKEGQARGVSRSAISVLMSELRMIEHDRGVMAASPSTLQLRSPYAMGVVCAPVTSPPSVVIWVFPADSFAYAAAEFRGYAYRDPTTGAYRYHNETGQDPAPGGATTCTGMRVETTAPGQAITFQTHPSILPAAGTPVLLYQEITYTFAPSSLVPGRRALWRQVGSSQPEEMVAPFDSTARFRYFWGTERGPAQDDPPDPANLSLIHGVELVLDGLSERPDPDGTHRNVPLRTAVYFKNRRP